MSMSETELWRELIAFENKIKYHKKTVDGYYEIRDMAIENSPLTEEQLQKILPVWELLKDRVRP